MIDGLDYILPLNVSGAPPAMTLLTHGLEADATVSKERVHEWLRTIYVDVY
jgi:hypothetical protein